MNMRERIKQEAKKKKITLNYLAECCGVTPQTFHRKLSGDITMDMETLQKIAQILGTTVGHLLGEVEIIKSSGMVEVTIYDLVSGNLKVSGVRSLPVEMATAESFLVRDGNVFYVVDESIQPGYEETALCEIYGQVTIKKVIFRDKQIQVGDSVFDKDAVKILGKVTGAYTPIR